MIKSVTVTNQYDESIDLVLTEPESSGFIVRSIDGLGPVKSNIHFEDLATIDGAIYTNNNIGTRNIVISFIFIGTPLIEDTRITSYRYFSPGQNLTFKIITDHRECEIDGIVESNVPNIFDKKEGCQVSILCSDPYFRTNADIEEIERLSSLIELAFEFPFSNESVYTELISFGNIASYSEIRKHVWYPGDSKTGFITNIYLNTDGLEVVPTEYIYIGSINSEDRMIINPSKLYYSIGNFHDGDIITINTINGSKEITLYRDGTYHNVLNTLDTPISWTNIFPGNNDIYITTSANNLIKYMSFDIDYDILYAGV